MTSLRSLLLAAAAATSASAHMLMTQPPLFGDVTNAPLINAHDGATLAPNYPCKAPNAGYYDWKSPTDVVLGEQFTVHFKGQSVHGGGSCQFSVTKDKAPTIDSDFKVIHSVEGGCPARNANNQNLGADDNANAPDPDTYTFTINPELEPGQYTFAWTWFNKVGNREMYMNCAPINVVKGGDKSPSKRDNIDWQKYDDLPSIMVANNNAAPKCVTEPQPFDVMFPNPGNSIEVNKDIISGSGKQFMYPKTYCEAPNPGKPLQLDSSLATKFPAIFDATGPGPVAPSQVKAVSVAPAPSSPAPSSVAAQGPAAQAPAPSAAQVPAPSPVQLAAGDATPASVGATAATPSPGGCLAGQQSCSAASGAIYCFSATSFGTCNNGCAVPMPVADGTTCQNGSVTKRSLAHSRIMHKHRRHWSFQDGLVKS